MTTMQSEIFEAFRAIGVPEDKALKAAEILGHRDDETSRSFKKHDDEIAGIKTDLAVLKWMSGSTIALLIVILTKLFFH